MTSLQRALMDVELNSLCKSFSSLSISSPSVVVVTKKAPVVLVGPVETILEEVASKREGYEFPSDSTDRMSDAEEYVQRRKDSDRMVKLLADKFREEMVQAGTPFCVCVPLMNDFVPLNNNNDNDNNNNNNNNDDDDVSSVEHDEDMEVLHVEEEETTTTTTHFDFDDDDNVDDNKNNNTDKAVLDGSDDCDDESTFTTETTTTVPTDDDEDEEEEEHVIIEEEQDEIPDMSSSSTNTTTTTVPTDDDEDDEDDEEEEHVIIEEEQDEIPDMSSSSTTTTTTTPADDEDEEVIPPTVILQLLLAVAQYWIGSTVKFVLRLATLPLAVALYIIYKTMKSLTLRIKSLLTAEDDECDGFEFDYDEQSVDSDDDDETLLLEDEDEVLEMLYSRQYATEEEFQKAWEFELGTETNR
eukprot:CAMPEP_0113496546 /NCGR_PEP_ID=MMETSP0014_2-20120614/30178_1 /TAXON_ID=2857 /ORGANISM="Nitzschia sp." /LENGTH=411 /DNA_ID=CAMNT_0000390473 /DNA_START=444 /DNA_END=1675 /DNA_ORIENTATION=- /assembly_acc=CAM_ASM_000159